MTKRNLREKFEEGWNKLFGKEEDKGKLRTQSLFRAQQKNINLNAGTPHDWEDLKKYQEEENNNEENWIRWPWSYGRSDGWASFIK